MKSEQEPVNDQTRYKSAFSECCESLPRCEGGQVNINRAGNQTKAYWNSQERFEKSCLKDGMKWIEVQVLLHGHAAGWMAGVAWAKRKLKSKNLKP